MLSIPILSRLSWEDYKRLSLAITLLFLEGFLRCGAWMASVLDFVRFRFFRWAPRIFRSFRDEEIEGRHDPMIKARTTPDLIRFHGYETDSHLVLTSDGYILQMFRILPRPRRDPPQHLLKGGQGSWQPVDPASPSSSPASSKRRLPTPRTGGRRPPMLALHGCMLSSEIWVCQRKAKKNLVLRLVEEGYDVWLANRRGTPYSQKHLTHKPYQDSFWNFSLDETILHDIPALVEYIISVTGEKRVALLGFSQGSAEVFGSLAFSRRLRRHVSCVVALSATAKPPTPRNPLIQSMVHWTPELLFLLFGRKSMLKSVYFWQSVLSPTAMAWLMDASMYHLFGWTNKNIRAQDKPLMYRHLFSLASVKQVAHWFQIMRAGRFQMYDDMSHTPSHQNVPSYPLGNINVPMLLFIGEGDCLADSAFLKANLDLDMAEIHVCERYEHIDSIWAHDADRRIHPRVLEFLESHCRRPKLSNGQSPVSLSRVPSLQ